jgi:hypothetical protein
MRHEFVRAAGGTCLFQERRIARRKFPDKVLRPSADRRTRSCLRPARCRSAFDGRGRRRWHGRCSAFAPFRCVRGASRRTPRKSAAVHRGYADCRIAHQSVCARRPSPCARRSCRRRVIGPWSSTIRLFLAAQPQGVRHQEEMAERQSRASNPLEDLGKSARACVGPLFLHRSERQTRFEKQSVATTFGLRYNL